MEIILSFGNVHLYVITRGGRLESLKKHPHKMDSSKSIPYVMTPQSPTVCMSLPSDFVIQTASAKGVTNPSSEVFMCP